MTKAFTQKQTAFIAEYLKDLCATQAAIRAGYSEKTAGQQGDRLLKNVEIAAAVDHAMRERGSRTKLQADDVIKHLQSVVAHYMALYETKQGYARMVNAPAAIRALELLGKHLGMFTTKIEHGGELGLRNLSDADLERRIAELTTAGEPSLGL
jgi:phage terminase small subunit